MELRESVRITVARGSAGYICKAQQISCFPFNFNMRIMSRAPTRRIVSQARLAKGKVSQAPSLFIAMATFSSVKIRAVGALGVIHVPKLNGKQNRRRVDELNLRCPSQR